MLHKTRKPILLRENVVKDYQMSIYCGFTWRKKGNLGFMTRTEHYRAYYRAQQNLPYSAYQVHLPPLTRNSCPFRLK